MIDLDCNAGYMIVYCFAKFEKSWNVVILIDTKLCGSVRSLWRINAGVLYDEKSCTAFCTLFVIIDMKKTHFTILFTVVGSHWSHDDTVLDRHMFDGKWLENVFVFAFH